MDKIKYINNDPNIGWKLHLSFDTSNKQVVDHIELFLSYLSKWFGVVYKVGRNSGQTGKDATIYCGSKKDAQDIANFIKDDIGLYLQHPHGDALKDDILFNDKVAGRFTDARFSNFNQYGGKGIPFLNDDVANSLWHDKKTWNRDDWYKKSYDTADKILRNKYGEYYTGRKKKVLNRKVKRCVCKKVR